MTRDPSQGEGPCARPKTLRVLRVDPGDQFTVRFLSATYAGLVVHWWKGRSIPCHGEKVCAAEWHRMPVFWKGYAPVVVWQPTGINWWPFVLEITEHLELDLRGRNLSGEEWSLTRPEQTGRKATPVAGTYRQTLPPADVPSVFRIEPCLYHLYHTTTLKLDARNPLPPRILVEPVAGSPPLSDQVYEEPLKITPKLREQVQRLAGRLPAGGTNSQGGTNGHGGTNSQGGTNGHGEQR